MQRNVGFYVNQNWSSWKEKLTRKFQMEERRLKYYYIYRIHFVGSDED